MNGLRSATALALVALAWPASAPAQQAAAPAFDLSVASIMRGPELVGDAPAGVEWSHDGRWVFFRWKPGGRPWHERPAVYRVAARGGEPERLSDEAADSLGVLTASGPLSRDERRRAVTHQGDLYVVETQGGAVRRLTDTRASETSPVWSRDGRTLYFVRDDNLFAMALSSGALRQLTDVRTGPKPEEKKEAEGQARFLEEQQVEIFEHVRVEKQRREEAESRRKAREEREPEPVWLAPGERLFRIGVEPAGRFAVIEVGKQARGKGTMVPDWVTASGYTEPLNVRSKVGDAQSEGRMALVALATGEAKWLELAPADSTKKGEPRLASTSFLGWNEAGTHGLIQATAYDYKDAWIYVLDAATGALTRVAHERDDAWIGGPCSFGCAGWMPSGDAVYFVSERDGYSHLYTVGIDGRGLRQLTRGPWEVHQVQISPDEKRFYLKTNEGSPYEYHFYHMALDGGRRTRVTTEPGFHDATPSPDGERLAVVHSYSNRPPELYLMDNRPGAPMRRITHSPTAEWESFGWVAPEIVEFTARDGVKVPARIYRPRDVGAVPNGAGVVFVHGAGYLQNVHRGWSSYFREYMFHHLLARRGFTVMDVDYRGSEGYGRDWRTAVYRHMGGKDLDDVADAARWLVAEEGVQSTDNVGVYGGSYGGFITLMALFTAPEDFGAGAALRSVTDWAHYNHWYTSRILNQPQDDSTAYRQSSPIYFAEGLEDPLLIAHGMVDTNVHFQDVVRLAQRLIELGKDDWEMAVYPVEDHGFVEPSSWTDEYRRILKLFETHLVRPRAATEDR